MKRFEPDPISTCSCGVNPVAVQMVEILDGRWVEFDEAIAVIESYQAELLSVIDGLQEVLLLSRKNESNES